jgi:hypothetical protein
MAAETTGLQHERGRSRMKDVVKVLSLAGACIGLVAFLGAPWSGALLSGVVVAGMLLHGARCEHADATYEPSTFHRGTRRPPHWYCADCGRTWEVRTGARGIAERVD